MRVDRSGGLYVDMVEWIQSPERAKQIAETTELVEHLKIHASHVQGQGTCRQ